MIFRALLAESPGLFARLKLIGAAGFESLDLGAVKPVNGREEQEAVFFGRGHLIRIELRSLLLGVVDGKTRPACNRCPGRRACRPRACRCRPWPPWPARRPWEIARRRRPASWATRRSCRCRRSWPRQDRPSVAEPIMRAHHIQTDAAEHALTNSKPSGLIRSTIGPAKNRSTNINPAV